MRDIPPDDVDGNLILIGYFIFKTIPSLVAGLAIYLGYRLFILGVTGEASLAINTSGLEGQLLNAAPGLFFALGGIWALIVTVRKGVEVNIGNTTEQPDGERTERRMAVNQRFDEDT